MPQADTSYRTNSVLVWRESYTGRWEQQEKEGFREKEEGKKKSWGSYLEFSFPQVTLIAYDFP